MTITKAEHISAEAARLFARHGYEGVTMRHVADASGVTMATLYYHFASKEALHEEITQLRFAEFFGTVVAQWRASPTKTPSTLIGLLFDEAVRDPIFFLLMQHDLHHFDEGHRLISSRKRYQQLYALIRESLQQPRTRPFVETEVFILSALITGLCELAHADQRARSRNREVFIQANRAAIIDHVKKAFD